MLEEELASRALSRGALRAALARLADALSGRRAPDDLRFELGGRRYASGDLQL